MTHNTSSPVSNSQRLSMVHAIYSLYTFSQPDKSLFFRWTGFKFVLNIHESLRILGIMYSFKKQLMQNVYRNQFSHNESLYTHFP